MIKITDEILDFLDDFFDLADASVFSSRSTKVFYKRLYKNRMQKDYMWRKLSYLHKRGYLKYQKDQENISIKLTTKGKIKLLENKPDDAKDGKWRLLSFDIPEKEKGKRNRFRAAIKRIGFKQVQKSLWACPLVKANKVELAINYYKVKKYVAYLIVEKSNIQIHLKNLFSEKKTSNFIVDRLKS